MAYTQELVHEQAQQSRYEELKRKKKKNKRRQAILELKESGMSMAEYKRKRHTNNIQR